MSSTQCLWCEALISDSLTACPECGCHNPTRVRTRRARPGRILLAVLALPLMASIAFASQSENGRLTIKALQTAATSLVAEAPAAVPVAAQPVMAFADPEQKATWVDGRKSLGSLLGHTSFTAFLSTGAGNVVSLCGNVNGTEGYQTASGQQRYISVFGRPDGTVLETDDPSFGVLWDRVCRGSSSNA